MDETSFTPLSGTLVESPVHVTTAWSMSEEFQNKQKPGADIFAMPESLNEVPEWLRTSLYRFLRLKQRNWPAKTVRRSARQLFNRLNHITTFFIQHYEWSEWQQLTPHWLEDYIDTRLREGISPGTINWDLIYFRALCQFLVEEGYDIPKTILKLKMLDTPQRLPRPLSTEQVRRLERGIQKAITEAKTECESILSVRDLVLHQKSFVRQHDLSKIWHSSTKSMQGLKLQTRAGTSLNKQPHASSGLRTALGPRLSTWVYIMVVFTSLCPNSSCTVRMS